MYLHEGDKSMKIMILENQKTLNLLLDQSHRTTIISFKQVYFYSYDMDTNKYDYSSSMLPKEYRVPIKGICLEALLQCANLGNSWMHRAAVKWLTD